MTITIGLEEINDLLDLMSVALMDKSNGELTYNEARAAAERVVNLWLQGQLGSKETA